MEKKKQQKGQNIPKDQRRPRQRNQPGPVDKKVDIRENDSKAPQKPVYEEPGPEFYNNLKRETDEILKITEEENAKYKKKEIQSNWSKYEMQIESYDEIQEQENMGADYEKLIDAPLSIGGHFQFKHEKSWDVDTGPTPYDKYFNINMDSLFLSLSTIPFYELNIIQKELFTDTDILNINNRATRAKQKYFNDKSFTTPDMEIQEKILQQLSSNITEAEDTCNVNNNLEKSEDEANNIIESTKLENNEMRSNSLNEKAIEINVSDIPQPELNKPISKGDTLEDIDDIILGTKDVKTKVVMEDSSSKGLEGLKETPSPKPETQKAPVIESPEDLEKWLDDFLDA